MFVASTHFATRSHYQRVLIEEKGFGISWSNNPIWGAKSLMFMAVVPEDQYNRVLSVNACFH